MNFISTAKNEGATILYGGARPRVRTFSFVNCPYMDYAVISFVFLIEFYGGKWQHLRKGFFIEPTIITDVSTSMQIWREEVFGPVLCVKTFSTEHEAIELANDTEWVTSYLHRFVLIFWILLHSQQFGNVSALDLSQLWFRCCCNFKRSGKVWALDQGKNIGVS